MLLLEVVELSLEVVDEVGGIARTGRETGETGGVK